MFRLTSLFVGALAYGGGVAAAETVTVVEYYNTRINAYFITGRAHEQALLDGIADFRRTGMTFEARAASAALPGQQPVCRYQIRVTQQFSSHFYGLPEDCSLIARLIAEGRITNFIDEGLDFAVEPVRPDGSCAAGTFPVYRSLRLGGSQVDVPNHRYSVTLADRDDTLPEGFSFERAVFCVPLATPLRPREDLSAWEFQHRARCAVPRTGISPLTGRSYPDLPGSVEDEKRWLRGYTDLTYLWWRESPRVPLAAYASAFELFSALKSPAHIVSGRLKDVYSWREPTSAYEQRVLGRVYGYGLNFARFQSAPPRRWTVSWVDPGSPAEAAGIVRGDRLVSVDGVDFESGTDVGTLNRGLFPPTEGEVHVFEFESPNGRRKTAVLTSADLPIVSVPMLRRLLTPSGAVGYIHFTTFSPFSAEKAFADAVAGLLAAGGVSDLVLDLRYNAGGSLTLSSRVAFMLAGPTATHGKRYARLVQNEKKAFGADAEFAFLSTGSGNEGGVAFGAPLPTLNLRRLYVLTGPGTASASEAVINGLRGIGMEVITIGGTTYGKPVGQYVLDNCGTSYNLINFVTVNHEGRAEYFDGFAPVCAVADDFSHELGDPNEALLAAALMHRASGRCPNASSSADALKRAPRTEASDSALALAPPAWERPQATIALTPARTDRGMPVSPRTPFEIDLARHAR
ncbi:MAG: S41 family peptidase [Casimicrobiaceae bacterium]|nr:S41 family peptidase [Casimicrobiaceae bacterium]MDW8312629.1 S41 family peptidase [Burkholderiales bacterium]